jgi:hypothetical protein
MKRIRIMKALLILMMFAGYSFAAKVCQGQPVVGLDNWYNREVNAKTGAPFHYLWTDTAFSGYSRWGKIFTGRGAKITTLEKPDASVLGKVDITELHYAGRGKGYWGMGQKRRCTGLAWE